MTRHRLDSISSRRDRNGKDARSRRLEWVERTLGQDSVHGAAAADHALVNPAACFASPQAVLRDPKLSQEGKREILLNFWNSDLIAIRHRPSDRKTPQGVVNSACRVRTTGGRHNGEDMEEGSNC